MKFNLDVFTYLKGVAYTTEEVQEALTNVNNAINIGGKHDMIKDLSWLSTDELTEELNKRRDTEVQKHIEVIKESVNKIKQLGVNFCDYDGYPSHIDMEYDKETYQLKAYISCN